MRLALATWVGVAMGSFALYKGAACVLPTPRGCTEIGCADGVFAEAAFSDHIWPVGAYRLELQLDDEKRVCTFGLPADQPPRGSISSVGCDPLDPRLEVSFEQAIECMEQRTADAVSQSCEPLEGQYILRISAMETPARIQFRLERDGVLVSQQKRTLEYTASQPNGPDCGPVCRQSNVEIRLD